VANTTWSKTYTDFVTATAEKIGHKTFQDQITRASPFSAWIMKKGHYLAGISGNEIEEPLMTELNDTVKWYSGSEEVDTNEQNVGTAAFFQTKQLIGSCTITGEEKRRNKGKEATIKLTAARMDQTMISIRNQFAISLFESGAGTKQIQGIPAIAPDDRGASVDYGRVTAGSAFWLSQRSRTQGGTYGDVGDFDTNFESYGMRLFNDCCEGSDEPDIHVVTQEVQEKYRGLLKPFERTGNPAMADLGYNNIMNFMGAPVVWDRKHPDSGAASQRWYMLNSDYLYLRYSPEANFSVLGFQRAIAGDYITTPVIWHGALTTNHRRMHGVATGLSGLT